MSPPTHEAYTGPSTHTPSYYGTKVTNTSGGTYTITSLAPNTKYYVRAWARSAAGYTYSSEFAIKTKLNCGAVLTDQDGYTYNTVTIGSQCWMKGNLRAAHYDNSLYQNSVGSGTAIPDGGTTHSTTSPYKYNPNNSYSNVHASDYYGYLYNWTAASGSGTTYSGYSSYYLTSNSQGKNQGVCPRGWHLPSQTELNTLNGKLNDYYSGTTTNFTAFGPKYAGDMYSTGTYANFTSCMFLWSSENATLPHYIYLRNDAGHGVTTYSSLNKAGALSVRCIQD
jgi:uncharacterized protein (TIGR02145 family)